MSSFMNKTMKALIPFLFITNMFVASQCSSFLSSQTEQDFAYSLTENYINNFKQDINSHQLYKPLSQQYATEFEKLKVELMDILDSGDPAFALNKRSNTQVIADIMSDDVVVERYNKVLETLQKFYNISYMKTYDDNMIVGLEELIFNINHNVNDYLDFLRDMRNIVKNGLVPKEVISSSEIVEENNLELKNSSSPLLKAIRQSVEQNFTSYDLVKDDNTYIDIFNLQSVYLENNLTCTSLDGVSDVKLNSTVVSEGDELKIFTTYGNDRTGNIFCTTIKGYDQGNNATQSVEEVKQLLDQEGEKMNDQEIKEVMSLSIEGVIGDIMGSIRSMIASKQYQRTKIFLSYILDYVYVANMGEKLMSKLSFRLLL
jgi:hypothetical protein